MSTDDLRFEAARILNDLNISPSELGYRAQALFAETLARMGATIDAVARTGHPDVTAQIGGRLLRIQVKATRTTPSASLRRTWKVSARGSPRGKLPGDLAVAPPLTWTCIRYARVRVLIGRPVPLAMLKSMEDAPFSSECTDSCVQLLIEHRASIEAFTSPFCANGV